MENKADSKITLEKFHSNVTGRDSFYVGITSDDRWAMRSEWFEDLDKAEDYYQKAIDNKCIGTEKILVKEVTI